MTENERIFRDAFRGYNKEDVNAYIASIAESTKASIEAAEERAGKAEKELEGVKAELDGVVKKSAQDKLEAEKTAKDLSDCQGELQKANTYVAETKVQNEELVKAAEEIL